MREWYKRFNASQDIICNEQPIEGRVYEKLDLAMQG
jgi:hypothetical protein